MSSALNIIANKRDMIFSCLHASFFMGDEASFECCEDEAENLLKEYQHPVLSEVRTEYIQFFYGRRMIFKVPLPNPLLRGEGTFII